MDGTRSDWNDLTEPQRGAAGRLGYDQESWDADGDRVAGAETPGESPVYRYGGHPDGRKIPAFEVNKQQDWNSMHVVHQLDWQALGWSQQSWDSQTGIPKTATTDQLPKRTATKA